MGVSAYEDILKALAAQQAASFNSSPFSQAVNRDLGEAANSVAAALMAPGNALQGQYSDLEIMPDGSVAPFSTPMLDAAANMAGVVSLGSAPMPRPANSLGMGLKMFHGSPDPRWMDRGEAFSSANPVTAPSKYFFASPKREVAETYAGISEMQRWKAEQGMGAAPSEYAGIRKVELNDGAKVFKVGDVKKASAELGTEWGGPDSLENLLDAAKAQGYDAVQMLVDGGNYAILNPAVIKKVTVPK